MTRGELALVLALTTAFLVAFLAFCWATDPTVYPP